MSSLSLLSSHGTNDSDKWRLSTRTMIHPRHRRRGIIAMALHYRHVLFLILLCCLIVVLQWIALRLWWQLPSDTDQTPFGALLQEKQFEGPVLNMGDVDHSWSDDDDDAHAVKSGDDGMRRYGPRLAEKEEEEDHHDAVKTNGNVLERGPLRVLIANRHFDSTVANRGGPLGEITLFRTVIAALRALQDERPDLIHVTLVTNDKQLSRYMQPHLHRSHRGGIPAHRWIESCTLDRSTRPDIPTSLDHFDRIITDQYSIDAFVECGHISSTVPSPNRGRYRLLDYWGTPPEQNWFRMHLSQFWTPYEINAHNMAMGIALSHIPQDFDALMQWKRELLEREGVVNVVIWGKEPKYFSPPRVLSLLHEIDTQMGVNQSSIKSRSGKTVRVRIHTVVKRSNPSLSDSKDLLLPSFVHNHGFLDQAQWIDLLRNASMLIGIGDPVMGHTATEALSQGCVYMNFQYPSERVLHQNPRDLKLRSQHPYVQQLFSGTGMVVNYNTSDQVIDTLRRLIMQNGRARPVVHDINRLESITDRIKRNLFEDGYEICTQFDNHR